MSHQHRVSLIRSASTIAISVELSDSLKNYAKKITKKLPGVIRRIALESKSFWKSEAGRRLRSSRNVYVKNINFKVVDELSFYMTLDNPLAVAVEKGGAKFDLKPGFMVKAKPINKFKIPRAVAATLPPSKGSLRFRIIPLNVNRLINMQKPKVFRTVTDKSPVKSWVHKGWSGANIVPAVITEMNTVIIPKHVKKFLSEI